MPLRTAAGRSLILGADMRRARSYVAGDEVDGASPVAPKAFNASGVAMSPPIRKRSGPADDGPGRGEHAQGFGSVYDDAGVLGFRPGLTVLTGLAPPMPSARPSEVDLGD